MPWLAALDRARRSRSSVPGAPAYIIPCSNILAALRNCARDDIGGRPGDYFDAACLARVPSGQGGASSLIIALLGGLLLCGSFFVFGYICSC